jgi:hypothetical protein
MVYINVTVAVVGVVVVAGVESWLELTNKTKHS